VVLQLRHDPRTVALLVLVPVVLLVLCKGLFADQDGTFNQVGAILVGIFPLISMFLVTSITMLRERTTGTLERLLTMPMAKLDLLLGYGLAFAAFAIVQATVVSAVAFWALGLDVAGSLAGFFLLAILNSILGMALGLFASAFAKTEFQAVQFMPAFILPQLLLCGLFVPRDQMWRALEILSYALPMTYAVDAIDRIATDGSLGSTGALDVGITIGATLLVLALGAMTLRRRTA
jgi:ABC-2 type transport system permease protein